MKIIFEARKVAKGCNDDDQKIENLLEKVEIVARKERSKMI